MSVPVVTFFNNKGGVGKTSLVFHLAWKMAQMGRRVLAIDLDPQANLTSAFLDDAALEKLWDGAGYGAHERTLGAGTDPQNANTIFRCVKPLLAVGDLLAPQLQKIDDRLHLIPGDLALAGFEEQLSQEWPNALGSGQHRAFRVLSAFWQIAQLGAKSVDADIILADVGPNLGAINRSALIGSDFIVIPLAADLFSLQGLRNLGPTLERWRVEWNKRVDSWSKPEFELPLARMQPLGYVLMQHAERLSRPVKAFDKWAKRIPDEYRQFIGPEHNAQLARVRNYRSLVAMGQEVRRPVFDLRAADGAVGAHAKTVLDANDEFTVLAKRILSGMGIETAHDAASHFAVNGAPPKALI